MKNKPNLLATPILMNVMRECEMEITTEGISLTYDSDKIYLNIILEDTTLECSMFIGSKKITLTDAQLDIIYTFISEELKEHEEEEEEYRRCYTIEDYFPEP